MKVRIPITSVAVVVEVDTVSGDGFIELLKYWEHKLQKKATSFKLRGHTIDDNKNMLRTELFFCLRTRYECPECKHLNYEINDTDNVKCEECAKEFSKKTSIPHGGWNSKRGAFNTYAWTCLNHKVGIWLSHDKIQRNTATADKLYVTYRCPKCQTVNNDTDAKEIVCSSCETIFAKTSQAREDNRAVNELSLFSTSTFDDDFCTMTDDIAMATPELPIVFIDENKFIYNKEILVDMTKILNEREIKIIQLHFGLNGGEEYNLAEISQMLHIYRHSNVHKNASGEAKESAWVGERVRQLEAKALQKLKAYLSTQ